MIIAGNQPGGESAVHLERNPMKKSGRDRKAALEVLDWIRSLDLPKESSNTSYEYFRDNNVEEVDQTQLLEYKAKLLSTGWKLFVQKHKHNLKKKLALLRKDVTSAVQMSTVRLRLYVQRWRRFVARSYLSTSAKAYVTHKYEGRMKYRYLLRAVIGYWALRVRSRARSKRCMLAIWRRRCNGHALVHKVNVGNTIHTLPLPCLFSILADCLHADRSLFATVLQSARQAAHAGGIPALATALQVASG
jgi:hypothetical protein